MHLDGESVESPQASEAQFVDEINRLKQELVREKQKNEETQALLQQEGQKTEEAQRQIRSLQQELDRAIIQPRQRMNQVNSIFRHLQLRDQVNWKEIKASHFKNIQLLGYQCDGLVMQATLSFGQHDYPLAIKMMLNLYDVGARTHFENFCQNEINILPQLMRLHPNIVRQVGSFNSIPTEEMINYVDNSIRDLCCQPNGSPKSAQFLVQEYYEHSLKSVIGNLNERQIIRYAIHLSRGLLALYESRIVHLDIKSDNLMISSADELVIANFGCAKKMNEDNIIPTFSGGNILHLSPEVYQRLSENSNSQQIPCNKQHSWELGVMFYEMVSGGRHPFENYPNIPPNFSPDLSGHAEKFHYIFNRLLCPEGQRMSILEAWNYLEEAFPGYA